MHAFARLLLFAGLVSILACTTSGGGGGGKKKEDTEQPSGGACSNGVKDEGEVDVDCGGDCGACAEGKACIKDGDCASGLCGPAHTCESKGCANDTQDGEETGIDCGGECPLCPGDECSKDTQCLSGFCKAGKCDTPSCTDGLKNGKETGVDCGAGDCALCGEGSGCLAGENCTSGFCNDQGKCATASCDDGAKNQGETDVDCGGACGPCEDDKGCKVNADCKSGKCASDTCAPLSGACADGEKGPDETDVDCGGVCAGCGFGRACDGPEDCASGQCTADKCEAPESCGDAKLTPGETDVDCGGKSCKPCALASKCNTHADCLTVACVFGVCEKPACDDGVQNGDETDADCGGPCSPCKDGKKCAAPKDCEGGNCSGGYCGSCGDGQKNGDETDTDCGGPTCKACADGKVCSEGDHCLSGMCAGAKCISCSDKALNGSETDTDCGGVCGPCGLDKKCKSAGDCDSGGCEGGVCCQTNACGVCGAVPKEVCNGKDDDCDDQTDEGLTAEPCSNQKGVCAGAKGSCQGDKGWVCEGADYTANNAAYETTEVSCDNVDNDCNGKTDDPAGCAVCKAAVQENKESSVGTDKVLFDHDFFCMNGATPVAAGSWVLEGFFYTQTYLIPPTGNLTAFGAYSTNGGAIACDGKDVYSVYDSKSGVNAYLNVGMATGGTLTTFEDSFGDNHTSAIAVGGGKLAVLYVADVGGYNMVLRTSSGLEGFSDWSQPTSIDKSFDSEAQLEMTSKGEPHVVWRPFGGGALKHYFKGVKVDVGEPKTEAPSIAVGPDDSLHLAYVVDTTAYYRHYSDGWSAAKSVGSAVKYYAPAVAVTPEGTVFVVTKPDMTSLTLSRLDGAAFTKVANKKLAAGGNETILKIKAAGLAGGVVRFGAIRDTYPGNDYVAFGALCAGYGDVVCTKSCTNKVCGDDGCGGSCGTCTGGKTCDGAGKCVSGCTPNCTGKKCGSDGCTGTCGTCAAGETCTAGACVGDKPACGDVTFAGCCDGNTLKYCDPDKGLVSGACPAATPKCGWDAKGYYNCGSSSAADPSGANPIKCGGTPVVTCGPAASGSCSGKCNLQSGSCYCDPACVGNNDCCPDYKGCCVP